ncbi:MAG: endonuclease/exonuclease/phosphatase family protein [Propylenella sp.]
MVQYSGIRFWKDAAAKSRTLDRLLALRTGLATTVTQSNKQSSFHLATWNIRDLGGHRLNPAPRSPESLIYVAEIISAFDLVAVQEVNEDMREFKALMRRLGPYWEYIVTDQSGNMERLAFVYDTRKIRFRNLAGEIVLAAKKGKTPPQFNRTPFLVAFQAGWFKFNLCTVHIYYGSADDTAVRKREIGDIANFFAERQKKNGETYILLGDFNILNPEDELFGALLGGGFEVPAKMRRPTAFSGNFYDQIALRTKAKEVEIVDSGVFQWQDYVFRDDDFASYSGLLPKKTKTGKDAKINLGAYRTWRTWQMSDHLPLWAEIKIDFTEDYLKSLKPGGEPLANFPDTGTEAEPGGS